MKVTKKTHPKQVYLYMYMYLKQVYLHLYVLDLKLVPTKEMTKGHLDSEIRSKSSFYIQRFRNKCHLLARVAFIWPSISPFFVSHLQS